MTTEEVIAGSTAAGFIFTWVSAALFAARKGGSLETKIDNLEERQEKIEIQLATDIAEIKGYFLSPDHSPRFVTPARCGESRGLCQQLINQKYDSHGEQLVKLFEKLDNLVELVTEERVKKGSSNGSNGRQNYKNAD